MDKEEDTEVTAGHDDIDEDIKLLKIVLQDDDEESESDGELQVLEQNGKMFWQFILDNNYNTSLSDTVK